MLKKRTIKSILLFVTMLFILSSSVFAATYKKTVRVKKVASTVEVYPRVKDIFILTVKDGNKIVTGKAKYVSSKKAVATVNKKGEITAKKDGTTIITVKYNKKSVKVKVNVRPYQKTPQEEHEEIMKMIHTPPKDYAELEARFPHSTYGQVRVYPELLRPTFPSNMKIKFNTVYYIYSEDDRTFGQQTYLTTISNPGRNTLDNEAWSQTSYDWPDAWVNGNVGGTPKYRDGGLGDINANTIQDLCSKLYEDNTVYHCNTAYNRNMLNGKVPDWVYFLQCEDSIFVYGSIDNHKNFFFYILPNLKTGHCVKDINMISTQIRMSPADFVLLYTFHLDDYAD